MTPCLVLGVHDPKYRWTDPLHYANVRPGGVVFDMERDCPKDECVVGAVEHFANVLRDGKASQPEKLEALKFLAHFLGDLHQPLHVSRRKDRGGNDIKIEFFNDRTNLHRVWDTLLLRHAKKPRSDHVKDLLKRITAEQRKVWTRHDARMWATESYRLAIGSAYVVPQEGVLGQAYFDRNILVIEMRLKQAGVRLGAMLNDILGGGD